MLRSFLAANGPLLDVKGTSLDAAHGPFGPPEYLQTMHSPFCLNFIIE